MIIINSATLTFLNNLGRRQRCFVFIAAKLPRDYSTFQFCVLAPFLMHRLSRQIVIPASFLAFFVFNFLNLYYEGNFKIKS